MSNTDETADDVLSNLSCVDYDEDAPRDPFWWRKYELSKEQQEQYLQDWRQFGKDSLIQGVERIIREGGGFVGRGVTHQHGFPTRIICYVTPLKDYFTDETKRRLLQGLESVYQDIKREIEQA